MAKTKRIAKRTQETPKGVSLLTLAAALGAVVALAWGIAAAVASFSAPASHRPFLLRAVPPLEHPFFAPSPAPIASSYAKGCAPKTSGRAVRDRLLSAAEARQLRSLAERALALTGGGAGGPSVFDLSSGAVSKGRAFVDIWKLNPTYSHADELLLHDVLHRIREAIEQDFALEGRHETQSPLRLVPPLFFARINASQPALTEHDQYWHEHVDTKVYGAFSYTSLLYLNEFETDFTGGRFRFADDSIVEPREGRLLTFSSGAENKHRVERVESGIRFVLTIAHSLGSEEGIPLVGRTEKEDDLAGNFHHRFLRGG